MKTKRFLSALLALMLVLGSLPAALAATDPTGACNHPSKKWEGRTPQHCMDWCTQHEICTVCGNRTGRDRQVNGAHSWDNWFVTEEATCEHEGQRFRTCRVCDEWLYETVSKKEHTVNTWTTLRKATCAVRGLQEGKCVVCGAKVTRETATPPHTVTDWTVTTAPSCTKPGSRTGTCTVCGGTATEKLEATGHTWDEGKVTRAAKCESVGYKDATCTVCGKSQRVTIPATGHTWGEWKVTIQPDGANRGKREHRCTVCNKYISEYFYEEGTLKEGDEGDEVLGLNTMLEDLGYNSERHSNKYTSKTKSAVSKYQKTAKIKASGVADPKTQVQLNLDWQRTFGIPDLLDKHWPLEADRLVNGHQLLEDWRRTRPVQVRVQWGPWKSDGHGKHYRTSKNQLNEQYQIEDCDITFIEVKENRTIGVCYLCGYKYLVLPNGWKMILEDGVQYISNGDDTHTVVVLDQTNPVEPYIEKHELVPVGSLECNESGMLHIVCKKCGCEDYLDYIDCAPEFTIQHQEPPVTEARCSGTRTVCGRCGLVYEKSASTGISCIYQRIYYRTDAELAAFEAKHPGKVTEATCYAVEYGPCINCGLEPIADELMYGLAEARPHSYALVDGKPACVNCGKPCPTHEKGSSSKLKAGICLTCGLPLGEIVPCKDDEHNFKYLTFVYGNAMPAEIEAIAAGMGAEGFCYADVMSCSKCGQIALDNVVYEHNMVDHPDGYQFCTACGMKQNKCDHRYQSTVYRTDAELAACEAKHPGVVKWDTCSVTELGNCLYCGEPAPKNSTWYSRPHCYQFTNGKSVCLHCGRECAYHEAEAATGEVYCGYCGEPFKERTECADGEHVFYFGGSVLTNVYGNNMTAEVAALAAEAGVSDFCYAELQICEKCHSKLRLYVLRYNHNLSQHPNGDTFCTGCGYVIHKGISQDAKGALCQPDGTALLTCKCCGQQVKEYAEPSTMTHDFTDEVNEYCFATVRHCKRCGKDVYDYKEDGACDFTTSVLTSPDAIQKAGYDPEEICKVEYVVDHCKVCGRPAGFSEPGPFAIEHYYTSIDGKKACIYCGRTAACTADSHVVDQVWYFDKASYEASPYNVHNMTWGDSWCAGLLQSACTACGAVTEGTGYGYSMTHDYISKDGYLTCFNCGLVKQCEHQLINGWCKLCDWREECADGEHIEQRLGYGKQMLKNSGDYPDADIVEITYCTLCKKLLSVTTEGHEMSTLTAEKHRCDHCGMTEPHNLADGVCTVCGWKAE